MPPTLSESAAAAALNTWAAVYPEIALGLLALGLLVAEIVLPRRAHAVIPRIAMGGILLVLAYVALVDPAGARGGAYSFGGLLRHSGIGQALRIFFLLSAAAVTWMGTTALERRTTPRTEFFAIVLVATAAMMLLVQSHHFVMLFVALETVTVCLYVLVAYYRDTAISLEAGLKYLVLGALSSAILTFGIVLLYGAAGNRSLPGGGADALDFAVLRSFLERNPHDGLALIGVVFVLSGLAFKLGAFPFHVWIPDVYQGAPTPVTAFLAVASKGAGAGVVLVLVAEVFAPLAAVLVPGLVVVAAATILFGNFAALTQRNTKRLLGLSGISHAGFLLVGIVAAAKGVSWAAPAVVFYLFAYMLASMAVFGVLTHLTGDDDSGIETDAFTDLGKTHPLLGAVLAVGLGSLAGIPPLAGFIGKALLFVAAFKAGLYGLLGVAVVGVILSIYYYFGWMRMAWFDFPRVVSGDEPARFADIRPLPLASRLALGGFALASVVLGFFQGPLSAWVSFN